MGFVWDRRKIKMLYSRSMSETSRRIVWLACVVNLEGTTKNEVVSHMHKWVFAVDAVACVCFSSNCHYIRLDC